MSGEKGSERGFTVVDKRGGAAPEEPSDPASAGDASPDADLPEIDFSTFVLSLGTSALYHLGMVNDPEEGRPAPPNLPLARQTIDTLAMLQVKTRGNLEEPEANLIENLLYELRMRFVEADKGRPDER